jgi:replicative DNA helicase
VRSNRGAELRQLHRDAEIDLVKHRNGEIGMFYLTFQGQYTRFANYAPDAYAEGVLR